MAIYEYKPVHAATIEKQSRPQIIIKSMFRRPEPGETVDEMKQNLQGLKMNRFPVHAADIAKAAQREKEEAEREKEEKDSGLEEGG